jgi:selenide, water dikinase
VSQIKLTEYSQGGGCGCKIAPALLEEILKSSTAKYSDPRLLVGNESKDDAAVFDLGNGHSVISTTDFFMPIVDDPFEFGQIAATNAISDVYAMGGTPLMAIAIFGWPVSKLGPDVASQVIEGGRHACKLAGIPLAGGHSIDAAEPIFGLAVTGQVENIHLKRNDRATAGCQLFLTKPLGIGVLTKAKEKKLLKDEHKRIASEMMCQLNKLGAEFGRQAYITAMTDVTGFGLMGHLSEICEGSGVRAVVNYQSVPKLAEIENYVSLGCSPAGTQRNLDSYGHKLSDMTDIQRKVLCDPQTSGGLLVAVEKNHIEDFITLAQSFDLDLSPLGELFDVDKSSTDSLITVVN